MRSLRRLIGIVLLATVASLGVPAVLADGPQESPGITSTGPQESPGITTNTTTDIITYLALTFIS
jgi:hypothetical protein